MRRAEERQPPFLRNTIQQIRAATAQQGTRGVGTCTGVARATNDAFIEATNMRTGVTATCPIAPNGFERMHTPARRRGGNIGWPLPFTLPPIHFIILSVFANMRLKGKLGQSSAQSPQRCGGLCMPLRGGEAEPSDGLCSVLRNTKALLKHEARVVLSSCIPLCR